MLAVARAGQEPIHQPLAYAPGESSPAKAATSSGVGGRPVTSKVHAADQGRLRGMRRRFEPFLFEAGLNEAIDLIVGRPARISRLRNRRLLHWLERPTISGLRR